MPVTVFSVLRLISNIMKDIFAFQILRSDLNSKIFDDLLAFTNTCQKTCFHDDQGHKDSFVTEISTAALVTG